MVQKNVTASVPVTTEPKIVASVELVTPEQAAAWLAGMEEAEETTGLLQNRNRRRKVTEAYGTDMENGDWLMTGEPIKFSDTGRLLDGQHRLAALIKAAKTVEMLIVRGLDERAQLVMDSGARRTAGDALSLRGEAFANAIAAAVRVAMKFEAGDSFDSRPLVTYSQIMDYVDAHPGLRLATETAHGYRSIDVPMSVLCFAYYMLSEVDDEGCQIFFTQLRDQTDFKHGDPVLALHKRITEIRRNGRRANAGDYLSLLFRSWNYWRKGEVVMTLPLRKEGSAVDIPVPR